MRLVSSIARYRSRLVIPPLLIAVGSALVINYGLPVHSQLSRQTVIDATVNPDFSDAPLDVRQVNTTRFSLFTPETRVFFLQDVAAFEFGGRNFARYALFAPNSAASASRTVSRSSRYASIKGAVSTMMSSMSRTSLRRL